MQTKASQRQSAQTERRAVQAQPGFAGQRMPLGNAGMLLSLQRSHGNRYVQRLLNTTLIQRDCGCSTCAGAKHPDHDLNREPSGLQRRSAGEAATSAVPPVVHEVLGSAGQPLDGSTRAFMEPRFGRDLQHVRIHNDAKASVSAKAVSALAYTVGQDIVFAEGQHRPASQEGQRLLAHELAHTVQQAGASPGPISGISQPGDASEREADSVADQVMRMAEPPSIGNHSKSPDEIAEDANAGPVTSIMQRTVQMSREQSKLSEDGPGEETEDVTKVSAGVAAPEGPVTRSSAVPRNVLPQFRSPLSLQRDPPDGGTPTPPASKCKMKSGPTYSPSGTIKASKSGGKKKAAFDLSAEFEGADASGCEIRQFILWTKAADIPKNGAFSPAASFSENTWYEDRDAAGKRYGHRTGGFAECVSINQYEDAAAKQDCAKGAVFKGKDAPVDGSGAKTGEWQFKLKAVDTSDGSDVGTAATVTIDWNV
jgi:hypothetical protein